MAFNASQFVPINRLVKRYGVKAVIHGGPGTGKTPLLMTAPNACFAFAEPGLLSIRKYTGPATLINTWALIDDFVNWMVSSNETRNYQTLCLDSLSQMAEIILSEAMNRIPRAKDPRQFYGELGEKMGGVVDRIYYKSAANIIMLAKRGSVDHEGITKYRPYFPGEFLNVKVPHLFDSVWSLEKVHHNGQLVRVMRTQESSTVFARDRSGNLAELENPDLSYLIQKSMQ